MILAVLPSSFASQGSHSLQRQVRDPRQFSHCAALQRNAQRGKKAHKKAHRKAQRSFEGTPRLSGILANSDRRIDTLKYRRYRENRGTEREMRYIVRETKR